MAIQFQVASSLSVISEALIRDLKDDSFSVFDKQFVITQTYGVNNWLRQQLAIRAGIAAGLRFNKMNDILELLYRWLCNERHNLIDKDSMTWAIFSELNEPEFCHNYPGIATYYEGNESKRAALASEMADLYDQYQVYRHDKITAWNRKEDNEDPDMIWQTYLWRRMKERLGNEFYDRLDVSVQLLEQLDQTNTIELIKNKMPVLRFFGIAIVTPYYLELFRKLSEFIDVKFYLLNPCPNLLWMDDLSDRKIAALLKRPKLLEHRSTGNELLVNWGSVLRDSFHLLLEHDDYVNQYDILDEIQDNATRGTLLGTIQSEINENKANAERQPLSADMLTDGSITLNGCFTPVREVEVFYNYLVHAFSSDPSLGAREILVMVTDIDLYAPFIKAVFDNAPVDIPYSIADESVSKGNTLFTAVREILSVNQETFKAEEVLSLLDSPYIRRRFGFSDITAVRQAVREAGICFGTGNFSDNDPVYEQTEAWMVSWEYGLQKIMYGLCMNGEEEFKGANRTLFPLDTAEGAAMADRIRLYHFVQVLIQLLEDRRQPKTLAQWSEYLGKIMSDMLHEEDEDSEDIALFTKLTDSISLLDNITSGATITYSTFRHIFLNRLDQERRTNRFAGRGVSFCSMLPMRSIPYKIIAMLGMDFDKFPRQDSALSFNLIGKEKRPGDRSVRENDKHLFLETIVAAKSRLYISYLARDVQKGSDQPPSTLVDELLDYIALKAPYVSEFKKTFTVIHPLHVFSERYCQTGSGLPANYLGNMLVAIDRPLQKREAKEDLSGSDVVSVDQFASFFKHPIKYYFNRKLGVYYNSDAENLSETELFELDKLQEWQVKDELLNYEWSLREYGNRKKKAGQFPLAKIGDLYLEDLNEEIVPFADLISRKRDGHSLVYQPVNCQIGQITIEGQIPLYGNRFIVSTISSNALRQAMDAWVRYLFLCAQSENSTFEFCFIFKKDKVPFEFTIPAGQINSSFSLDLLKKYMIHYQSGQKTVLPFYPNIGFIFYQKAQTGTEGLTRENLTSEYEKYKANDKEYHKVFSDGGYLEMAIDTADENASLFSESSVVSMNQIIPEIMQPLFDRCPDLFK